MARGCRRGTLTSRAGYGSLTSFLIDTGRRAKFRRPAEGEFLGEPVETSWPFTRGLVVSTSRPSFWNFWAFCRTFGITGLPASSLFLGVFFFLEAYLWDRGLFLPFLAGHPATGLGMIARNLVTGLPRF